MRKRVLEKPDTAGICTLETDDRTFVITEGHDRPDSHYGSKEDILKAFESEFDKRVKQGWQETPVSLSRRVLQKPKKKGGKDGNFWLAELDRDQVFIRYGRMPGYLHSTDHVGTLKTKPFDSEEEARYEYVQQILKKMKEGYVDVDPRDNEFTKLVDDPPPKPQSSKPKRKAAKKAARQTNAATSEEGGIQRYEFDDGKSKKFWAIELNGKSHTVTFGRIGTKGQTKTKEHASEESARKSYEKLIGEKTGKGYELISAAPSADKPPAAEKQRPAKSVASTEPDIVTEITNTIDLAPIDLARARFRNRKPVPKPQPREFDLAACVRQLSRMKTESYGWVFRWQDLDLPAAMSPEEAHFWLDAMTFDRGNRPTPQQVARKIEDGKFDGKINVAKARQLIERNTRGIPRETVIPLGSLLKAEEIIDLAVGKLKPKSSRLSYREDWLPDEIRRGLAEGFTIYVAPYLGEAEVQSIQKRLKKNWDPTKSPDDSYSLMAIEYYFAAACGMHDEVLQVTNSWPDDRYRKDDQWSDHYQRPQDLLFGLGSAKLIESEWRRLRLRMREPEQVRAFLACTRTSALDCLVESILEQSNKEECRVLLEELARVKSPAAAEPMLQCKQKSKAPQVAREWLDRYVGNAVAGLIATANGRGSLADVAIQYLRDAKRKGYGALIETAVAAHKGDAQRVVREVIDHEEKVYPPLDDKSTPAWLRKALHSADKLKGKKLPAWVEVSLLPQVPVGNKRLNNQQYETLLGTLKSSPFPEGHELLTQLREKADREALESLAWRLFELWQEDGAPSKEKWAMQAIAYFGGDNAALKLTPFIRQWPGESQHQRAVLGLECLRGIGSDTALMQLNGIAQKVKFQGIKKKAREYMEAIAAEKNMTREELEDRVVPDLDLDEQGRREFDFGSRKFTFALTPDMKPAVRDEKGKVRKDLPKPASADSATKAEAAIADWKLLKKQLRESLKIQVPRLEQAMVTGRRWSPEQFESLLVRHPFMTHLTRTVLWGGYGARGKLQKTFRVTDEQDYADSDDEPFTLEGIAQVGIVHPLHLSDEQAAKWGEVFSDYEIASPFPLIGRPVYGLEKGEAKAKVIDRFGKLKIPAVSLVGTLDRLGWIRGTPLDGGVFHQHSKPFYGANVTAVVAYEEGVPVGYMDGWDDQKITGCYFLPGLVSPSWDYPDSKKAIQLGKVDPIVISEVLADLNVVASKGS